MKHRSQTKHTFKFHNNYKHNGNHDTSQCSFENHAPNTIHNIHNHSTQKSKFTLLFRTAHTNNNKTMTTIQHISKHVRNNHVVSCDYFANRMHHKQKHSQLMELFRIPMNNHVVCSTDVACNILSAHPHRHDDFFQPFVSSAKQHMYVSW